jgi:hypothetical protein
MRNNNSHNGHNGSDSRLHSITSHVVMRDGRPYSGNNTPGNGRKTSRSGNAGWKKSNDIAHVPIDFRAFSDGTLVELVRNPSDSRPRLLILEKRKGNN